MRGIRCARCTTPQALFERHESRCLGCLLITAKSLSACKSWRPHVRFWRFLVRNVPVLTWHDRDITGRGVTSALVTKVQTRDSLSQLLQHRACHAEVGPHLRDTQRRVGCRSSLGRSDVMSTKSWELHSACSRAPNTPGRPGIGRPPAPLAKAEFSLARECRDQTEVSHLRSIPRPRDRILRIKRCRIGTHRKLSPARPLTQCPMSNRSGYCRGCER